MDALKPAGKRVLVRVDFNVPMKDGAVSDSSRIERAAVTIRELQSKGARIVLLSHFGRPKGHPVAEMSLRPIASCLETILGQRVVFASDCIGTEAEAAVAALENGQVALLENLRFHPGEEKNDPAFAAALAKLGDLFVSDAFSAAHRAHASVEGLARLLPAVAGRLMESELTHLTQALERPKRPLAAVVGGAKVSSKLALLDNLVRKVDLLIIGGGMANTFLYAQGLEVGKSLCETGMVDTARQILVTAKAAGCDILLPSDVVAAEAFAANAPHRTVKASDVPADSMILDIGPDSLTAFKQRLSDCQTCVWNGPLGAFELTPFDMGTNALAREVADLTRAGKILSVAGGGDTVAALAHAGVVEAFSYVSAAGGAFLEWLEGKTLPGVRALQDAAESA